MSIKIEDVVLPSPEQWEAIIRGMRNPMNSWEKSDSKSCHIFNEITDENRKYRCAGCKNENMRDNGTCYIVGPNDFDLMNRLRNAGTEHRKYMRMMPVYMRITAPLYWWKEFDTYKVGTVANSCSTMHKIHEKEFTLEDFSCEHLMNMANNDAGDALFRNYVNNIIRVDGDDLLGLTIDVLNYYRRRYIKTKDKRYWWQMIQLLPSSYNQTRNVMLNYEVLANIYRQRHSHKLDEWREFCEWIETLPYSELIIGFKEYSTIEYAKEHPDFTNQIKEAVEKMTKCVSCENKLEEDEKNV